MIDQSLADGLDEALKDVAGGDIAAMRRLYAASNVMLYRVCFGVVRERETAEDLLQEVYLKVWRRAPRFSCELGSALGWLTTIARNTSLDWIRARERERRRTDRFAELAHSRAGESFMFGCESDHQCAMHAIGELDEISRDLIYDAFVLGMTYSELADVRRLALGTVKSRVRRGLLRVKHNLADQ